MTQKPTLFLFEGYEEHIPKRFADENSLPYVQYQPTYDIGLLFYPSLSQLLQLSDKDGGLRMDSPPVIVDLFSAYLGSWVDPNGKEYANVIPYLLGEWIAERFQSVLVANPAFQYTWEVRNIFGPTRRAKHVHFTDNPIGIVLPALRRLRKIRKTPQRGA